MTSVRDEPMQVAVESAGIRVVTTSTQGPSGPATVAAGSVVTVEGDLIIGGASGTPIALAKGSTYDSLGLKQSTGRPWYRKTASINWLDHGITASAVTDQTATAQTLIDALSALGGGVIECPPGTYRIENLILKDGVWLVNYAGNHSYRAGPVGHTIFLSTLTSGWVVDTPSGVTTSCGLVGIAVQGAGSASGGGGIRFRQVYWGAVRSVDCYNFGDQGFQQIAGFACVLEDITTTNCLTKRTRSQADGAVEIGGTDHYISRVEASILPLTAISSASLYVNAIVVHGNNCMFSSCVGELADRGWYIDGGYNAFSLCRGDRNWAHDWENVGGASQFIGCKAQNGGRGTPNTYDGFKDSGQGSIYMGCITFQTGADTYKYAYEDTSLFGSTDAVNEYWGCVGTGWATARFKTDTWKGSSVALPDKPRATAAAATTIDVSGTQFISLENYAAPATVTDFTGGTNGQHVYMLGNSNVTISHNATIKTNTAANKVLANDKMYHFISYLGVWREVV